MAFLFHHLAWLALLTSFLSRLLGWIWWGQEVWTRGGVERHTAMKVLVMYMFNRAVRGQRGLFWHLVDSWHWPEVLSETKGVCLSASAPVSFRNKCHETQATLFFSQTPSKAFSASHAQSTGLLFLALEEIANWLQPCHPSEPESPVLCVHLAVVAARLWSCYSWDESGMRADC